MDEAGAGIAVKNTARSTIILLQGYYVPMQRISTVSVVGRRTDSRKRNIAAVDTVAIVQRDGKKRLYSDRI